MLSRIMLAAALLGSLDVGTAFAQTASPDQQTPSTRMRVTAPKTHHHPIRDPALGDPGPRSLRSQRGAAVDDRPGPNQQNGNQVDRAGSGGGAH